MYTICIYSWFSLFEILSHNLCPAIAVHGPSDVRPVLDSYKAEGDGNVLQVFKTKQVCECIDNIDSVTGIGNCITGRYYARCLFDVSFTSGKRTSIHSHVVIRFLSGLGRPPELVSMANST